MEVNFPASKAQIAGNRPVFKALQRCLAGKVIPSRSDAMKLLKCIVKPFDRSKLRSASLSLPLNGFICAKTLS